MDTKDNGDECFPLFPTVNYLSRLSKDNFRSVLADNGLFVGQDEILFTVLFNNGAKPSEIAKKLRTSLASVSVSLKRLKKTGFIERKNDESDRRISHIYISEKGRRVMEKIRKDLRAYEESILKGFDEDEKNLFREYLDRAIFNGCGVENYSYKRPKNQRGEDADE